METANKDENDNYLKLGKIFIGKKIVPSALYETIVFAPIRKNCTKRCLLFFLKGGLIFCWDWGGVLPPKMV